MTMTIENARFSGVDETVILATIGGIETSIPVSGENRFYREIKDRAVPVAPYAAPPVLAADVKREAQRRIVAEFPEWKQRNLLARQVELNAKRIDGGSLTGTEQGEWDAAAALWVRATAVRTASDVLEAAPPADFKDDTHWPAKPVK